MAKPFTNGAYLRTVVCLAFLCPAIRPCELIHFTNGFALEAESHRTAGPTTIINTGSGTIEFPSNEIQQIDTLPSAEIAAVAMVSKVSGFLKPEAILSAAATAQGIDAAFVLSVAQIESGLRQASVSRVGAIGLMQLMPKTARELQVNPQSSDENARGGAKYLRDLLVRYKGDSVLALAAYNAGPGAVQKFRGVPPYAETRHYVLAVLKEYEKQRRLQRIPVPANRAGQPNGHSSDTHQTMTASVQPVNQAVDRSADQQIVK